MLAGCAGGPGLATRPVLPYRTRAPTRRLRAPRSVRGPLVTANNSEKPKKQDDGAPMPLKVIGGVLEDSKGVGILATVLVASVTDLARKVR